MIIFDVYTKISNIILFTHRFFLLRKYIMQKMLKNYPQKSYVNICKTLPSPLVNKREHFRDSPLPLTLFT